MFFLFFFGEHKFRVELHGNLHPGTSLISTGHKCSNNFWGILISFSIKTRYMYNLLAKLSLLCSGQFDGLKKL